MLILLINMMMISFQLVLLVSNALILRISKIRMMKITVKWRQGQVNVAFVFQITKNIVLKKNHLPDLLTTKFKIHWYAQTLTDVVWYPLFIHCTLLQVHCAPTVQSYSRSTTLYPAVQRHCIPLYMYSTGQDCTGHWQTL